MMKRTILRMVLICMAFVSILAGCSRGEDNVDLANKKGLRGAITYLTVHEAPPDFKQLEQQAAQFLMEQNPEMIVTVERIPYITYTDEIKKRHQEGKLPDLFLVWGGEIGDYAENGYLADLSRFMDLEQAQWEDYFANAFIEMISPHGTPVVIPTAFDIGGIVYRKSWFDRSNLPYPDSNWTWNDFVSISRTLAADNPNKSGAILPFEPRLIEALIIANGGSILSPDGKTAKGYLDGPASVDALEQMIDTIKQGITPQYDARIINEAYLTFGKEMAGMALMSFGYLGYMLRSPIDDYGFAALPLMNSGEPVTPLLNMNTVGISAQSQNQQAAWVYLKTLFMDDNEISRDLYKAGGVISRKVEQAVDTVSPYRAEMYKALEYSKADRTAFMVNGNYFPVIFNEWIVEFEKLINTNSKEELQEALTRLADRLENEMAAMEKE